jgi:hypothetical protein
MLIPAWPLQVLDLDETLVHSTLDQSNSHDFAFEVSLNNHTHSVNVKQRPHMTQFLTRCAELFEVVIFTASQKLYAEQLLNVIDPGRCVSPLSSQQSLCFPFPFSLPFSLFPSCSWSVLYAATVASLHPLYPPIRPPRVLLGKPVTTAYRIKYAVA